ncbi:hypothetical protein BQ9231_00058 [Cedratvirus lausannensis]|uniref:Uncharacterized protein n=2 Tax=Pithoviruses TaxID=2023203 RepID=A0A285PWF3_9VIRU|nr:hypothetical protein BQ9231_00058 [Cedratvirus lausannensis]SPN79877.1 Hypothetical protein ZAZAV_566 [Cedratvirus Zaza IHUMI]
MKFLKKKPKVKENVPIPQYIITERRTNQLQAVIDYKINDPEYQNNPERES